MSASLSDLTWPVRTERLTIQPAAATDGATSCFADNVSSWRLMERLQMRREARTVRGMLHRSGEWLDGFSYALLADEW